MPDATARVEILLDAEPRAELTAPPWAFRVDLAETPLPHELAAVAYDVQGEPLGSAFQRLGVPWPPVDVFIALEEADGRVQAARLAWEAAADEALTGFRVRLDGRPLPAEDPTRIPLSELHLERFHHLSAEVTLRGRLRVQAAVVFGGRYVDRIDAELTAVTGAPWLLRAAVDEFQSRLDGQLVMFPEGRPLPSEIALTAAGRRHVRFPAAP